MPKNPDLCDHDVKKWEPVFQGESIKTKYKQGRCSKCQKMVTLPE